MDGNGADRIAEKRAICIDNIVRLAYSIIERRNNKLCPIFEREGICYVSNRDTVQKQYRQVS